MTFRPVRISHFALYLWMFGMTALLFEALFAVLGEPSQPAYLIIGTVLVAAGLVIPVVHGLVESVQACRRDRATVRGEGQ